MSGYFERTSDSVAEMPQRALQEIQGAGGNKAISTVAPTKIEQAMGLVNDSQMISLAVKGTAAGADVTITLWLWNNSFGEWMYGGANSNDYTKIFANKGQGGFRAPKGAFYFLQGSINVDHAKVADACPKVSEQFTG